MRRPGGHVLVAGRPVSWLGVNFWSRTGGPLMWRAYDPRVVREELAVLARHGLGTTRTFCYWPDFQPEPDRVDGEMLARYRDLLDAHAEYGMTSIPTFLVGHMSGENWNPSWRGGRDLYADVWLVSRQAWFVEQVVRELHDHPAVAGWLVSNEMPIYGRGPDEPPAPTADVTSWATLLVQAVRAGGGTQPVSLGDGAWGIEVTGRDNGFSVRETGRLVDFAGPHVYPAGDDRVRQHLHAAFVCELAAVAGRPVVLEEFGLSTAAVSRDNQAHWYRQVLHGSLLGGATGWLAWNNTDYDHLYGQDPYRHHPYEMHFGVTTSSGAPKPALAELAAFAEVLDAVDVVHARRDDVDAALVVPTYLERGHPYSTQDDRDLLYGALRQAYVTAREADLPVGISREEDGLTGDARLYLLPSTRQLLAPTWHRLRRLAEDGAVVYLSYCAGAGTYHRGPWFPGLDELFGVEHGLAYGLVDPIGDDEVELRFTEDFGAIAAGDVLRLAVGGNEHSRAFLPVSARGAKVVAVDGRGRPAVLHHPVGAGGTVLCTYPLELMAAVTARVNPEDTWRLYDALAAVAGVRRRVVVPDPRAYADTLVRDDGRRFAWLVSQHPGVLRVRPRTGAAWLRHLAGGEAVVDVDLEPYGVRVLELVEEDG